MLKVSTWRDPYDAGFSTTRPREIGIDEGLTVLVGCNGAGKTTLLHNIREECKKEKIPALFYDNLKSGGGSAISSAFYSSNSLLGASLFSSSEGEAIKLNFGGVVSKVRGFLETGAYDSYANNVARIAMRHRGDGEENTSNKRVLLFDAIDSGLSVDSVAEIREVFDLVISDASQMGVQVYIVASANEYEMARHAHCFDVASGRYVEIGGYEEYRSFILESRKKKDKREERSRKVAEKRREKEEAEKSASTSQRADFKAKEVSGASQHKSSNKSKSTRISAVSERIAFDAEDLWDEGR